MAVNFNVSEYVDQQRLPLIKKAVLGARTTGLINLQAGVKGKAALNLIDVNPTIQGGGCGWNASGDATFSQREIDSKILKVNMAFCDKDFAAYWANYEIKIGAGKEVMPFEEYFTTAVIDGVNAKVETMIWQGNEGEGFKGLLPILDETDAKKFEGSTGDVYEAIKAAYTELPVAVLDKAVIFVGADIFRSYMLALVEKNLYHYPANGADVQEIIIPGTNTKVVAVNGLNGSNKIVGANPMNLFYGCDMLDDKETVDFWYSKDNREYRLAIQFNAGVQVAYPNEVVVGELK